MAEIRLFIASSIDGFIARENGAVDWLDQLSLEGDPADGGYGKFIADIDVLLMGRKSYEEVLGFGVEWPYKGQKVFVATTDESYKVSTPETYTINDLGSAGIDYLRSQSQKNIWLVGGGQLITHFLNQNAIDEMTLNIISWMLGKGIPLFPGDPKEARFKLVGTESYGPDLVNLIYRRK